MSNGSVFVDAIVVDVAQTLQSVVLRKEQVSMLPGDLKEQALFQR